MKTKIFIILKGGVIQEIHSETKVEVILMDHDLRAAGEPCVLHPNVEIHHPLDLQDLIRVETK